MHQVGEAARSATWSKPGAAQALRGQTPRTRRTSAPGAQVFPFCSHQVPERLRPGIQKPRVTEAFPSGRYWARSILLMGTLFRSGTAPGPHPAARIARVARSHRRAPVPSESTQGRSCAAKRGWQLEEAGCNPFSLLWEQEAGGAAPSREPGDARSKHRRGEQQDVGECLRKDHLHREAAVASPSSEPARSQATGGSVAPSRAASRPSHVHVRTCARGPHRSPNQVLSEIGE